ncbi:hypothetical protein IZU99_04005 [Oscillospiraceae bacterium CM]|nr:hypothetical protein IZU99_04005 [Oscillospiraceae bacterium CM]
MLEDEGYVTQSSNYQRNIFGLKVPSTDKMKREKRLEDNKENAMYVAAYLRYFQDIWQDEYPDIIKNPSILGALYNKGHQTTKPHSSPESNEFGDFVAGNYDYMSELLGMK